MKKFLFICMIFFASGLFAAPLNGNYPSAPRATPAEARQKVIDATKKYLGTPYVYAGLSSRGVDCSGLICLGFQDALGESLPRSAAGLYSWAERISLSRAQPGDLVFFKTGSTSAVTHVGLYLGDNEFIHAASAGAKTGVIYSNLEEKYYKDAFVSMGRALPAASANFKAGGSASGRQSSGKTSNANKSGSSSPGNVRFLAGAALAMTWDFHMLDGDVFRGLTSQANIAAEFAPWLTFGFEIRPEYDGALGVFRIPFTLSWGHSEIIRIFFGPVVSFGDAVLVERGNEWEYTNGTTWFGTVGLTFAPFTFRIQQHQIAPYLEAAWQSYLPVSEDTPFAADFIAGFRFSTGLRWRMQL